MKSRCSSRSLPCERTSGDSDLGRYRGEYVLKVQGPKGESVLRGRLKDCSAG